MARKKLGKTIRFSIIGIVIIGITIGYIEINKGKTITISNNVNAGESIIIQSENGNIRASLLKNKTQNKMPAVIMVVGSGATSYRKSWENGTISFWKPLSEILQKEGFCVLLLEKRGINGSAGHWEKQTFEDRAKDVKDAIDYLQGRNDIDVNRIGIIGHSQGGWIAQLTSVLYSDDLKFIVNLAGPSISITEQVLDDYKSEYINKGLSENAINKKLEWNLTILNIVKYISPIIRFWNISNIIGYDSEHVRKNITVPIFAVYAENDNLVYPEINIKLMEEGLKDSGNKEYRIYTIPNTNHSFKPANFNSTREELEKVPVSNEFLNVMHEFIEWEKIL
jgi:dienelactone hydrolase